MGARYARPCPRADPLWPVSSLGAAALPGTGSVRPGPRSALQKDGNRLESLSLPVRGGQAFRGLRYRAAGSDRGGLLSRQSRCTAPFAVSAGTLGRSVGLVYRVMMLVAFRHLVLP